ncbi:vicilin-like seed storage protein At2g18540 [Strongylocentrotus purpuratus]|uniref:Uncharacterized protein n=1 Tax=Strongylocentrotus purpuratus TaxID=7668 RepID=A0A7M7PTA0_STRPU|nr:vicilin-like seed storage protein At2g18540 [Strongylocentrotus purpuratus]XP_030855208.1 vicilin-like seed storage protein At2g18540 [Strongylocentrotus purpuratus]|eukprot:XP_001189437.1 PREDICTED: zinc finger CCCH domain-containing protein 13 [Strongylocentrotus purpuratus]
MGCGNSTPTNSKNNSLATLDSNSRPGSKTAPINKSLESVLRDNAEHRANSRTSGRDSGIDSAKTSDGRRRQAANQESTSQSNNNETKSSSEPRVSPTKALAFEVMVDHDKDQGESIIARHPPRRLQKLEMKREPTLTADMIEEKLMESEERRRQVLEERGQSSKRSSRRRKELILARQFGNIQDSAEHREKLEEKIDSASKNRSKAQADVVAKQKKRELRAKQAKERARRMREEENEENHFDVEKDETFNAEDDVDSWLDGDNNAGLGSASTTSERIYNGRSSPTKKVHSNGPRVDKSLDYASDSDDNQGWTGNAYGAGQAAGKDDFFDT